MNDSNPLDKARELGNAISQSKEYLALKKAELDFYNDKAAVELLDKFNSNKDVTSEFHDRLEQKAVIQNLFNAQKDYNNLIRNINNIVDFIIGKEKKNCSINKCGSCNCSKR